LLPVSKKRKPYGTHSWLTDNTCSAVLMNDKTTGKRRQFLLAILFSTLWMISILSNYTGWFSPSSPGHLASNVNILPIYAIFGKNYWYFGNDERREYYTLPYNEHSSVYWQLKFHVLPKHLCWLSISLLLSEK
jgi:hypothetical protein